MSYNILLLHIKRKHMFTKENGKKAIGVLLIVMVGLALHQKFVAPMLAPKAPKSPSPKV